MNCGLGASENGGLVSLQKLRITAEVQWAGTVCLVGVGLRDIGDLLKPMVGVLCMSLGRLCSVVLRLLLLAL